MESYLLALFLNIGGVLVKETVVRYIRLILGLFITALGFVFMLNANIGYASWDVFHVGVANVSGLTIGTVTMIVGIFVATLAAILGEKIGIGTLANIILIGLFLDIILKINIIPKGQGLISGLVILFIGLVVLAIGLFLYIGAGYGAGPRDALMVAVAKKTGLSLTIARAIIEGTVVIIGWIIGGKVGIGTIIAAVSTGFFIDLVCKIMKFDMKKIEHETLDRIFSRRNDNKLSNSSNIQ